MNREEVTTNNTVELTGLVVGEPTFNHEVFGEKFYQIMLEVRRQSDNTDTLPVVVSERLVDIGSIKVDQYMRVAGQLRTFNKHSEEHHRAKLIISVFAREIEEVEEYSDDQNSVVLRGFICKEPNFRTTPLGRDICDVLLAINRPYGKSDYIPNIAWGRNARYMGNLSVGTEVTVTGRLQSRTYIKKFEGGAEEERTAYEVSISKMEVHTDEM